MRIPLATLLAVTIALALAPASAQAMDDNGPDDACLPKPGFPGIGTDSDGFCDPLEESGGGGGGGGGESPGSGGGGGAGGGGGTGSGNDDLPPEVVVVEGWVPPLTEPEPPEQSDPPPGGSGPEFGFPEPPRRGSGAPKPDPRKECLDLEEKGKLGSSLKFGNPSAPERDWVEKTKEAIEKQKFIVEQARLTLMSVEIAGSKWEVEPRRNALRRQQEKLGNLNRSLYAVLEARSKWREKKCAAVLSPKK
jgi:hypothetical protein